MNHRRKILTVSLLAICVSLTGCATPFSAPPGWAMTNSRLANIRSTAASRSRELQTCSYRVSEDCSDRNSETLTVELTPDPFIGDSWKTAHVKSATDTRTK